LRMDAADVECLYRSRGHLVLRRARTLMGNEAEAQEALQEVFAALLRDPRAVHTDVSAWLYKATTHWCLNQLRKRRNGTRLEETQPLGEAAAVGSAEAMAEARRLLARLPAQVAAAAVYHHVDGMTHSEVAAMLGCSRRQVGYLLERARDQVAQEEQSA